MYLKALILLCSMPGRILVDSIPLFKYFLRMKKVLLSITLGVLLILPAIANAQKQVNISTDEAMAEMPVATAEKIVVKALETPVANVPNVEVSDAPTNNKSSKSLSKKELRRLKKAERKARRQARKVKRAQKFLNSRLGKWLVKRAVKKAQKRQKKYQRKAARAAKKGNKKLQEKYEKKALTGNMRIGVILLIIGVILSFFISILGVLLIIAGLVFILLALL